MDRFGNLQLAATVADARVAGIPSSGSIELAARIESGRAYPDGLPHSLVPDGVRLRCVDAFGELKQGEFGLLVDANGHLAVVAGESSAATGSTWRPGSARPGLVTRPGGAVWCRRSALGTIRPSQRRTTRLPTSPTASTSSTVPEAHPRGHGAAPAHLPAHPRRAGPSRFPDGLLGTAGGSGPGQCGQGAQGPVPPGVLRHPRHGLRARVPGTRRWTAPSASTRTGRWPSSASATWAAPSPTRPGSPHGAARSPRSTTWDPAVVGEEIRGMRVRHMDEIATLHTEERPDIGVVTTPDGRRERSLTCWCGSGSRRCSTSLPGSWTVPPTVHLRYVDLSIELQVLGFYRARAERAGRAEERAPMMRSVGLSARPEPA